MSSNHSDETSPKMKRKEYEKKLRKLQAELCRLQEWVVHKGLRVIVVFEGDAAGKGGTIKAIMERVSPRVFRLPCRRRARGWKGSRIIPTSISLPSFLDAARTATGECDTMHGTGISVVDAFRRSA